MEFGGYCGDCRPGTLDGGEGILDEGTTWLTAEMLADVAIEAGELL